MWCYIYISYLVIYYAIYINTGHLDRQYFNTSSTVCSLSLSPVVMLTFTNINSVNTRCTNTHYSTHCQLSCHYKSGVSFLLDNHETLLDSHKQDRTVTTWTMTSQGHGQTQRSTVTAWSLGVCWDMVYRQSVDNVVLCCSEQFSLWTSTERTKLVHIPVCELGDGTLHGVRATWCGTKQFDFFQLTTAKYSTVLYVQISLKMLLFQWSDMSCVVRIWVIRVASPSRSGTQSGRTNSHAGLQGQSTTGS